MDTLALADQQKHQLCADSECQLEGLPRALADRDGWRERVKRFHTVGTA